MTSSGPSWFLFLLRPFAEIGAELTKAVAAAPAFADYNVAMTIAQVDVTSRYGVWDPVSDAVVANP